MKLQQRLERSHLFTTIASVLFFELGLVILYIIFTHSHLVARWAGESAAVLADEISYSMEGDPITTQDAMDFVYGMGLVQLSDENIALDFEIQDMDWLVILSPQKTILGSNVPQIFPIGSGFDLEPVADLDINVLANAKLDSWFNAAQRIPYKYGQVNGKHYGFSEILNKNNQLVGYVFYRFAYDSNPFSSNEVLYFLLGGMIIALILSIFMAIFLSKRMAKSFTMRIQNITNASQKLAAGKPISTIHDHSGDEIDSLAKSFNQMAVQIKNQMDSLRDEMEIKHVIQLELEHIASYDSLTGLLNRRTFMNRAEVEFKRSLRYQHSLTVLMIDLDDFKKINDTHGHQTGDLVLSSVGAAITGGVRAHDLCGRYGGEEFIILMPETDLAEGQSSAERVLAQIRKIKIQADNTEIRISCSIGVAVSSQMSEPTLQQLINKADELLYHAKDSGKNKVVAK